MALELLAGPFPVIDKLTNTALTGSGDTIWVDPDGLLWNNNGAGKTYLIQMDGAAYPIGFSDTFREPGLTLLGASADDPLSGDPWYCFHHHGVGIDGPDERIVDRVHHNSGVLLRSDHPPTNLGESVTLHDRWLTLGGAEVRARASTAGDLTVERTIVGFTSGRGSFSWARERGHLWLSGESGHLVLYDYANKTEVGPVWRIGLTTVSCLYYSKKHDVFVSMHYDGTQYLMSVWARTPLPTSIAAPTFNVTPAPGLVVTATTRVLGSYNEPCADEVVTWTVVGEGELVADTSRTDADGYATVQIAIPIDATGPEMTVGVEVVVP
jgi:hypothetical protein